MTSSRCPNLLRRKCEGGLAHAQEDLNEHLKRLPFQPFRIHLSTGAFFDIHQPELAYTSRSILSLSLPIEGDKQRFLTIALIHIAWFEVLVPAS